MGGAGGVQSTIPALMNSAGQGAVFQLLSNNPNSAVGYSPTWSLGEPQPTIDLVQSLLLDGERPFGSRASNRTITLPVKITAPDQVTLTAARELLLQAVDASAFTLVYTPASTGLSIVFDCFRALPTVYGWGFLANQSQPISILTLTFQALPYGRTEPTALQQVAFVSPLLGGVAAPPSPLVLDNFSSVSGANWSQNSGAGRFVVGPASARYTPPGTQLATYTKSGISANITGLTVLSVWFGQAWNTALWPVYSPFKSNVTLSWTLTDNANRKLSFHRTVNAVPWSSSPTAPKFTRISAAIPQGNANFNYTTVTAYSVTMTNMHNAAGSRTWARLNIWLDDIVANPPSIAAAATQRGVVYNIMGAAGTARTPISCQFQLPPPPGTVSQELYGSGVWWPPLGVTSVKTECIGAGGSGGAYTSTGQGGGGGGGEYAAEPAVTVMAGQPVPFSVGAGGQSGASQSVVTFNTPGSGYWTCPAGVTTVQAECWGGGATGGLGSGGAGGGEYAAEPALTVTPGNRYSFTVGSGGGPGGVSTQHSGTISSFTGNSVTVTAHGGRYSITGTTAGGTGGTGSSNSVHFNGGNGGTAPSYGGGGGGGSGSSGGAGINGGNGSGGNGGAGASAIARGGAGGAGASKFGNPVNGAAPGGGGGAGYSFGGNHFGAPGGNGQVVLTYTVGAGNPVNGSSTSFGSPTSTNVTVVANGGGSAALNSATGAVGGTGSSNSVHFNGGAGGLGGTNGGGGGGSGGSASAGTTGTAGASGGTGAPAVIGGGKGSDGARGGGNNAGDPASPPGGGGGGANSTGGGGAVGGTGGTGNILLTWTTPLAPFGTLIAHRPGSQSPPELSPLVPIANTADPPTGSQYTVPSLTAGVNALFNGTYTVVLTNYTWDSPTVSRQITVTVNQYEYINGPAYPLSITRTVVPSTDIVNGIIVMGELTLPVKAVDSSNTSAYFTVSITDTDVLDQFLDILFLDTQGSTVMVNIPPGNMYSNYFIDEPTPDRDLGLVLGSDFDRSQAVSVMDSAIISGSPFYLVPGDNLFLAYCTQGAPNLGVTYANRWYLERLS